MKLARRLHLYRVGCARVISCWVSAGGKYKPSQNLWRNQNIFCFNSRWTFGFGTFLQFTHQNHVLHHGKGMLHCKALQIDFEKCHFANGSCEIYTLYIYLRPSLFWVSNHLDPENEQLVQCSFKLNFNYIIHITRCVGSLHYLFFQCIQ